MRLYVLKHRREEDVQTPCTIHAKGVTTTPKVGSKREDYIQPYQHLVNKVQKNTKKKKMMEEQMENNNMITYCFLVKKQKENTEESGTASTLHTESMTILLEDIPIALQYTS